MVSVIVPNYNHGKFLRERIDSILNQTYQDFELIILDDKSTDNSKEIIESYRNNSKVSHIVYNEGNSGNTFIQWEKGFKLAKGDFIWIAESDDIADLNFLKKLMSELLGDNEIIMGISGINFIDENNDSINMKYPINFMENSIWEGKDFIKKNMYLNNAIFNASSVIFKKDVLKKISKNYQSFKTAGDYLFWIEILEHGKIAIINEKLDYFRLISTSVTHQAKKNGINFHEIKFIYLYLKTHNYLNFFTRMLSIGHKVNYAYQLFNKIGEKQILQKKLEFWRKESTLFFFYRIFYKIYYHLKIKNKFM